MSDWNYEENQDRIKPDIWITRDSQYALFNAYNQNPYTTLVRGTAWAVGYLNDGECQWIWRRRYCWFGGENGFDMFYDLFNMVLVT